RRRCRGRPRGLPERGDRRSCVAPEQASLLRAGRRGADDRPVLPNLIVIGAAKCGTTSLHRYLDLHPEVAMSKTKQLHFFTEKENWGRGLAWYESHFDTPAQVRGESTPAYSAWPVHRGVPERIARVVPDTRLIYLVRDPVERV